MAAEFSITIREGAREVHAVLRERMGHVELVSEDTFRCDDRYATEPGGKYIAVLLYQQYFMRVGNQLALMVLITGDARSTTVKSVSCASSRDMLLAFDMGAAGDFAGEPIGLLKDYYRERASDV